MYIYIDLIYEFMRKKTKKKTKKKTTTQQTDKTKNILISIFLKSSDQICTSQTYSRMTYQLQK